MSIRGIRSVRYYDEEYSQAACRECGKQLTVREEACGDGTCEECFTEMNEGGE